MARYIQDIILNKPDDSVLYTMNDFFLKTGFVLTAWRGEQIYFSGNPDQEGCRCLKWSYSNGMLHLEAWLKGRTEGDEWDLEGLEYNAQKIAYRQQLDQLFFILRKPLPQQPVYVQTNPANTASPSQTSTNDNLAIISLILGILSIVCICAPFFSIIFGVIGIVLSRDGRNSIHAPMAKIGRICSIIGLIGTSLYIIIIILSIFWPW